MNCYNAAPEFIDEDNRLFRIHNPISKEQMHNKHAALLPEKVISGKSVLDLGCCIGATGHWCLANGAAHYTGVEFQAGYAQIAEKLLGKYHPGKFSIYQMAIEEWLQQTNPPQYDVVCLLGVIYGFVDYFSILKLATQITKSTLAIESNYFTHQKKNPDFCGVVFIDNQTMNISTETGSFIGRGTRISPKGMEWLMKEFGFLSYDGVILPKPIIGAPDVYNRPLELLGETYPIRYMMRFERSEFKARSVSEDLQRGEGTKETWER